MALLRFLQHHSSHLFDDVDSHDNSDLPTTSNTVHDDNMDKQAAASPIDQENHQRAVLMTVLFSVMIILYVLFCVFYQKVHLKVRRTVGADSDRHTNDSTGTGVEDNRQRLRNSHQAVLDESSNAASRARQNVDEQAKLEQRKKLIKSVLHMKLIVEEEFKDTLRQDQLLNKENEPKDGNRAIPATTTKFDSNKHKKQHSAPNSSFFNMINAISTTTVDSTNSKDQKNWHASSSTDETLEISTSESMDSTVLGSVPSYSSSNSSNNLQGTGTNSGILTQPETLGILNQAATTDTTTMNTPCGSSRHSFSSPSSNSCMDLKRYTSAFQNSLSGMNMNCSGQHHVNYCSSISARTHSAVAAADTHSTTSLTNIVKLYGEECNICISPFQVGDRTAVSNRNGRRKMQCRHAFHSECIERWLLVRDACPICRRSYFESDDGPSVDGEQSNDGNSIEGNTGDLSSNVVNVARCGVIETEGGEGALGNSVDLELGTRNAEFLAATSSLPSIFTSETITPIRSVVVVEED